MRIPTSPMLSKCAAAALAAALTASSPAVASTFSFSNTLTDFVFNMPDGPVPALIGVSGTFTIDGGAVTTADIQLSGLPAFLNYFDGDFTLVTHSWLDQNPRQFELALGPDNSHIHIAMNVDGADNPVGLAWIILETAQWGPVYDAISSSGIVPVSSVPLPGSLFLFGSGLFGLSLLARRRKAAS